MLTVSRKVYLSSINNNKQTEIMRYYDQLTATEKETLNHLIQTRNDFYKRGFNELASRVQDAMDAMMGKNK